MIPSLHPFVTNPRYPFEAMMMHPMLFVVDHPAAAVDAVQAAVLMIDPDAMMVIT